MKTLRILSEKSQILLQCGEFARYLQDADALQSFETASFVYFHTSTVLVPPAPAETGSSTSHPSCFIPGCPGANCSLNTHKEVLEHIIFFPSFYWGSLGSLKVQNLPVELFLLHRRNLKRHSVTLPGKNNRRETQ